MSASPCFRQAATAETYFEGLNVGITQGMQRMKNQEVDVRQIWDHEALMARPLIFVLKCLIGAENHEEGGSLSYRSARR